MSSIYYPESWMQHPEVLRLQQRVRELEQENEHLKDKYRCACDEIISRRRDAYSYSEQLENMDKEKITFNKMPFYKKIFFKFDF